MPLSSEHIVIASLAFACVVLVFVAGGIGLLLRSKIRVLNEMDVAKEELAAALEQSENTRREFERSSEMQKVQHEADLASVRRRNNELQQEAIELRETRDEFLRLRAQTAERERQLELREVELERSQQQLLKTFEITANRLFEEKSVKFQQLNREGLNTLLSPFRNQMSEFKKQVDDVYHKENTQRNQLIGQISALQQQAQKISEDANNLTKALKGDNRVQGQWGEMILEKLLEESGLQKGREYHTQYQVKEEGRRLRPDVVIHLPDNKDIVVDSKVNLLEYERFASAESDESRERHLKSHVDSLRAHMRSLSGKTYENLEEIASLDFVLLFVPIEPAYLLAVQHAPEIFREAAERNIMIVAPSSLMVALRTIESLWRYDKQSKNVQDIARRAGRLYDQFALVMEAFSDVGNNIDRARDSYDTAIRRLSTGRGNVLRNIEQLKALGAKATKSLDALLPSEDGEETSEP